MQTNQKTGLQFAIAVVALNIQLITVNSFAQEQQTTAPATNEISKPKKRPSPEQIAEKQSMHLQKALGLSADQKQKTQQAILTRTSAIKKIHEKYGPAGDKNAIRAEVKPVREQFTKALDAILTPDQKIKWEAERTKMKERRKQKHS